MRIFAAGLATETNTFAPFPAGRIAFEEAGVFRGDGSLKGGALGPMLKVWRDGAAGLGAEFVEGFSSFAQPAGVTPRPVYEAYRDEILEQVSREGPFDVVLLALHGAMVAEGYDDCEGDLMARIRPLLPEGGVIGAELDPHAHLTAAMLEAADAIVVAKEYPHVDFPERAQELFDICVGAQTGAVRPVMASFDCRMIGWYPTTSEPMRSLVDRASEMERERGVLSVSIVHGFPWADVAEVGARVLVVANGDAALAADRARDLGLALYAKRDALLPRLPPLEAALHEAMGHNGRVVLADVADNAGGGAPSDNTALLRAMLEAGVTDAACGLFWDPVAVRICADAGVGARLPVRLGGKCGPMSDAPLDVEAHVRGVREDHGQMKFGSPSPLGLSVWIEVAGIDVVATTLRSQAFSPDAFTDLGIDLAGKRLIAVKSSQHFRAGFGPIADHIVAAGTRGALEMDFAQIAYTKRDGRFHPRVPDPLGD